MLVWSQQYILTGHTLLFSSGFAFMPILALVLLLGVLRKPAWIASPAGLAVAFGVAELAYRMPVRLALAAMTYGAAFAIFPILWIIFWALCLLRVVTETGQLEIIKCSIGRLTADPPLQGLLISFAFAGFLEGAAGFGAPVPIAATMLVALGFPASNASAICLLANTAPVAFGSIGIPVFTLAATTGLSPYRLAPAVGLLCTPAALILPVYLIVAIGGRRAMRGIWLPVVVAGMVFGGGQLLVATFLGPQLTDILASLATILALVVLLRLRPAPAAIDNAFATHAPWLRRHPVEADRVSAGGPDQFTRYSAADVFRAWAPYGVLVLMVLLWGGGTASALAEPAHARDRMAGTAQRRSAHAAHRQAPGTVSGYAALQLAICLRNCVHGGDTAVGSIPAHVTGALRGDILGCRPAASAAHCDRCLGARPGVLMNYCGATATLGLACAGTGAFFPFFSTLLGWLGVFLTGSDTSANALFGNLQVVTAERLGLSPVLMAAAGSAGGVMGKMISLQSIAIAAAATGLSSQEQVKLFRFTLKHSIALVSLTGLAALALVYLL